MNYGALSHHPTLRTRNEYLQAYGIATRLIRSPHCIDISQIHKSHVFMSMALFRMSDFWLLLSTFLCASCVVHETSHRKTNALVPGRRWGPSFGDCCTSSSIFSNGHVTSVHALHAFFVLATLTPPRVFSCEPQATPPEKK